MHICFNWLPKTIEWNLLFLSKIINNSCGFDFPSHFIHRHIDPLVNQIPCISHQWEFISMQKLNLDKIPVAKYLLKTTKRTNKSHSPFLLIGMHNFDSNEPTDQSSSWQRKRTMCVRTNNLSIDFRCIEYAKTRTDEQPS